MNRAGIIILLFSLTFNLNGQIIPEDWSVARMWNEVLLEAIRTDQARPTIHARNLFHISAAMYDAWAAYDRQASPYFLNQSHRGFYIPFDGVNIPDNSETIKKSREKAISFAAYQLIKHRFRNSPNINLINLLIKGTMYRAIKEIGPYSNSIDYSQGDPAALGNYIAKMIIDFGYTDGSNELYGHENRSYYPLNPPIVPERYGTNGLTYPNHWQPLAFEEIEFVGQSGISATNSVIPFLGPEWGIVVPFSLNEKDLTIHHRNKSEYWVYHDPGPPAYLDSAQNGEMSEYQWGFGLVAHWSSHLDPSDSVKWDISPASIGNISFESLPTTHRELRDFYDLHEGGDIGKGYDLNPKTGAPYEPQIVPRGDYTRVLAEFWADGPKSETPPGHWFTILNYVSYHPDLIRKYKGEQEMDQLEWDVKAYFILGGAMHDAAITAWGIKGYYDYVRPISAIRGMAERGQASFQYHSNYDPTGFPIDPEYIQEDSSLGYNQILIRGWNLVNSSDEFGGVGWIPGISWAPYQRPSFVTPPFAGYISGHSTFSRAAANILSLFTGDEYFPGGMGTFDAPKNEFLVFEEGSSVDIQLQWAKYIDASDQCSLSRIWGGIHPPVDDIPGRIIGDKIGKEAFQFAETYFNGDVPISEPLSISKRFQLMPNPVRQGENLRMVTNHYDELPKRLMIFDMNGRQVVSGTFVYNSELLIETSKLNHGIYTLIIDSKKYREVHRIAVN